MDHEVFRSAETLNAQDAEMSRGFPTPTWPPKKPEFISPAEEHSTQAGILKLMNRAREQLGVQ